MKNIMIQEGVQLKVDCMPEVTTKATREGIADGKLETKRNEFVEKVLARAESQGLAIAKEDSGVELASAEAEVQTIDFATEIEPKLDKTTPMALPKQLIQNAELVNLAMARAAANDNPNGAYTIALETLYTDSISAVNEQRWYNFQLTEQKKLTAYMSPVAVASVDNDLMLYKLDTSTYNLNLVSKSQNRAGMYELLSYLAEPGIYYLCVVSFACSAPNNFNILARVSDVWDGEEADDSMALAKEQIVNKVVKRTLDNSLDEDCTIWLVEKTGNYRLEFFGVPASCNYQLQMLDANQNVLTMISKNTSTNFKNVAAGGYFIRVLSPDGVVVPTAKYGVLLLRMPNEVTDFSRYQVWFSNDNNHFVECLTFPTSGSSDIKNVFAVYVNGKPIDPSTLTFESYRFSSEYNKNQCGGTGLDSSHLVGVHLGDYGSPAPTVEGTKNNTLMMVLDVGYFSTYHMMRVSNTSYWPNTPDDFISGPGYYQGYWKQFDHVPMAFILDLEQDGMCIDIYSPNWFYGTRDRFGVGHESASFSSRLSLGSSIQPPDYQLP